MMIGMISIPIYPKFAKASEYKPLFAYIEASPKLFNPITFAIGIE